MKWIIIRLDPCIGKEKNLSIERIGKRSGGSNSITCPDSKSQCPKGNTCCLNEYNTYGCCPFLQAVCCKDKRHCCPHEFKCSSNGK